MSYDPIGIYASANTRSKERTRRRRRRVCLFSLLERVCFAARCTPGTETGATRTERWWSRREREKKERQHTSKRSVDRIFSRDPPESASIGFVGRFQRSRRLSWNYHVSSGYRDAVSHRRGFQLHRAKRSFPIGRFNASGLMFQANTGSYYTRSLSLTLEPYDARTVTAGPDLRTVRSSFSRRSHILGDFARFFSASVPVYLCFVVRLFAKVSTCVCVP